MGANDYQYGGTHYVSAYGHWDLVADLQLNYYVANATKYVIRHRKKNGLEDVLKAQHYVDKLLELINDSRMPAPFEPAVLVQIAHQEILIRFLEANDIASESAEWKVMHHLCVGYGHHNLTQATVLLAKIAEGYAPAEEPTPAYVDQGRDI